MKILILNWKGRHTLVRLVFGVLCAVLIGTACFYVLDKHYAVQIVYKVDVGVDLTQYGACWIEDNPAELRCVKD